MRERTGVQPSYYTAFLRTLVLEELKKARCVADILEEEEKSGRRVFLD